MFGHKLKAWMDAVRTKKKQHRKDKQGKCSNMIPNGSNSHNHSVTWKANTLVNKEQGDMKNESKSRYTKNHCKNGPTNSHTSRYSANNLSSPESAYSTGYSTDGTSPGAPPDYVLNTSRKTNVVDVNTKKITDAKLRYTGDEISGTCLPNSHKVIMSPILVRNSPDILGKQHLEAQTKDYSTNFQSSTFYGKITETTTAGLVSPRQRNRIRTNPWLPGGTSSATPTPLPIRQDIRRTSLSKNHRDSPIQNRYLSPAKHRRSLSSSSCSSLSGAVPFENHFQRSLSDEEDCTLNEMMGKYDESYIYEKETDILSDDSDPTDYESDIDTGQDGGDEDDTADAELEFIDNGSYIEIDCRSDNTGHCSYFDPTDVQKKRMSRRRSIRKTKEGSSNRRRSSNKKCHQRHFEKTRHSSLHQDGSRSAGATPVSVRRSNLEQSNLRASQEKCVKRRSNSVCVQRDCSILIEKRDKEADRKYRDLIGQAEQIIRTMNINGLSPRRLPAPTNKRIELLKSTECSKNEVALRTAKPLEENLAVNKAPSNVTLKNSRFSPKKNHITNFIINNSPVLLKKELQGQSPLTLRRNEEPPLLARKYVKSPDTGVLYRRKVYDNMPSTNQAHQLPEAHVLRKSTKEYHKLAYSSPFAPKISQPKSILCKNENGSPRHRRANKNVTLESSSSEEEELKKARKKLLKSCPQSEPVKRKVYFERNGNHGKSVGFHLQEKMNSNLIQCSAASSVENLRQQVLLNTIQTLKRSLEDQSAFLQQNYSSTQNMYQFEHF